MKNVLILSYCFAPAPLAYSQRLGKLCKYLPKVSDWQPKVICGESPWDILPGKDEILLGEINKDVQITRVRNFIASDTAVRLRKWNIYPLIGLIRKSWYRFDPFTDWIGYTVKAANEMHPKGRGIDVIFSSGPPNSGYVAGMYLSEYWYKPLVIDMRDPWSPLWRNNSILNSLFSHKSNQIEKRVYERSSAIITNTSGAATKLKNRFPEYSHKIFIIPNGFDPEDMNREVGPTLRRPEDQDETVHILNLGGFRGGKPENALLKVIADYLQKKPDKRKYLKVHFIGASENQISEIAVNNKLQDICRAYGIIPTNEIGRPLAEANIYTLLQPDIFNLSIPSKFFSYLAGGGYIFAMVPNSLENELLGEIGQLNDIIAFGNQHTGAKIIEQLIEKVLKNGYSRLSHGIPEYSLPYDRRNIARQIGKVLDKVTETI